MTPLERARDEVGFDELRVLDCHGHIGPYPGFPIPRPNPEQVVDTMNRLGIATTFVSALSGMVDERLGDREAREAVERFPGRLETVVVANPYRPALASELIDAHHSDGSARMVKIHPTIHRYPAKGSGYRRVFDRAAEYKWLVLSHTWGGDQYCDPHVFAALAQDHPGTAFILGHSGANIPGIHAAVEVARRHANIYLDLACSQIFDGAVAWIVGQIGPDRVLFGSDVAFLDPRPQLGRVLFARLDAETKRKILGLNLERLLDR